MPSRYRLFSVRLPANQLVFRSAQSTQRTFATASEDPPPPPIVDPLQARHGGDLGSHLPKHVIPKDAFIPAYPYGHQQLFKQANKGLYANSTIQFGNNVSNKTETKTRRYWKPNIVSKSLYSVALKKRIKLHITANVLKTIDREGGLDEYLLKDSENRIKELGPLGWALRWTLLQRPHVIDRVRADAAALGLDQTTIDKQWPTRQMMSEQKIALAATNSIEHDLSEETDGQEMWNPGESGAAKSQDKPSTAAENEKKIAKGAIRQYKSAVLTARRWVERGLVDSEEQGIKVAFIRSKERHEKSLEQRAKFEERLQTRFNDEDIQRIKTEMKKPNMDDQAARKIAYTQDKKAQIEQAGSYEAWRANIGKEWVAARNLSHDDSEDKRKWQAEKKAENAQILRDAENSLTDTSLDPDRRAFLQTAFDKADMALKAKAANNAREYVAWVLERVKERNRANQASLTAMSRFSNQDKFTSGDAWGPIADSNDSSSGNDSKEKSANV